jgi:ribosome biogenesis GTPase
MRIATVVWGANNIYTVRELSAPEHADPSHATDATWRDVRIKGKILPGAEDEYNPLAPGDRVEIDGTDGTDGAVQIIRRHERRNTVVRWNRKRSRPQALAANVDRLFIVTSARDPAYRAAFLDRVLVMAEIEQIPATVVCNKVDLVAPAPAIRHMEILRGIGYSVIPTSTVQHDALAPLLDLVIGATSAFFGQSGVGKSSLINALVPSAELATGEISQRFNRGRHTTTLARQVYLDDQTVVIDTPGVREYDLFGYRIPEIAYGFREFRPYADECHLSDCTHTHEPRCAVRDAVTAGAIAAERYESYRKIMEEAQENER